MVGCEDGEDFQGAIFVLLIRETRTSVELFHGVSCVTELLLALKVPSFTEGAFFVNWEILQLSLVPGETSSGSPNCIESTIARTHQVSSRAKEPEPRSDTRN